MTGATPVSERAASSRPGRDAHVRVWLAAVAVVLVVAAAGRVHNLVAYPPLYDFDGPGHAANVLALARGELPDPASWSGFHPPLYYALGVLVWRSLPDTVPVHVGLRALSAVAGAILAGLVARGLRRFVSPVDAAIVATLVFCTPVFILASSMLGNEMLGACLVTAALVRLLTIPEPAAAPGHAAGTGLWLAAALLTKASALGAVGVAALTYAVAARAVPRRALAAAALSLLVPLLLSSPHYARMVLASRGSVLGVVSGAALATHVQQEMKGQPPGERHLGDYLFLPLTTFLAPHHDAPGLSRSVPGLLYASTWADGHGQFLPASAPGVLGAEAAVATAGLLPTLLAFLGAARFARAPRRFRAAGGPLLFGAILSLAWLRYTWILPAYSAVKASYLLPATLPAALLLSFGLDALGLRARNVARVLCLALALGASLVFWGRWS